MVCVLPVPGGPYSRMPLRVDCPNRRSASRLPDKAEDVAIEQLQRQFGKDDLLAADRRQSMDHDAA